MRFRPRVTFWFVLAYILAAFGWWTYIHIDDNGKIQDFKRELLELKRVQAQRDVYANLLEQKFNTPQRIPYTLYFNGRVFGIDTTLLNAYFEVSYPEMELTYFESGISVEVKENILAEIDLKERNRNMMFLGEGIVFVALLFWGFLTIFKGYREKDELNAMQSNFLMSVTHELKTPLASTKLMLQTMRRRKLDEQQTEKLVDNSLEEINRLDSLIEKILLASRFENPHKHAQKRSINLSELCKDTVERLSHSARLEGRLFGSIEENISIQGDVALLISVLINLIENAGKYAPGSEAVRVILRQQHKMAILQVVDEGPGISDADKKNIFKKFYRIGSEETRTAKGTGLGLFIVKNIIEDMGGSIQVRDNQPKGAIFEITLPALAYELQDTFS
jgi:signal transduction histidine kinase